MARQEKHPDAPFRNFYGRRAGKTLRQVQKDDLESRLEPLTLKAVDWFENPERKPVDPGALFPDHKDLWLEIGFGGGEHLVAQAAAHKDVGFIGAEPFINGVAMLLAKIKASDIDNLVIHPGDVRDLFDVLPKASVGRAFLLYPDPWPKARHHRRRFVTPEHLDPLAEVMKPGAILRVATDIEDYVRQTLWELERHPAFDWQVSTPSDWRKPWDDWTSTRYEQKALREGRRPHYLTFKRR